MKRIWLWAVIAAGLALSGLAPIKTQDAAELLPARVLLIWTEDGWVHTRCDAGAEGTGTDLEAALVDMERTAQGALFLDTAEHIVLHGGAKELTAQTARSGRLRPAAKLYLSGSALPDAEQAAEFLLTHSGDVTLGQVRAALLGAGEVCVPRLVETEGRLRLFEG